MQNPSPQVYMSAAPMIATSQNNALSARKVVVEVRLGMTSICHIATHTKIIFKVLTGRPLPTFLWWQALSASVEGELIKGESK